MKKSILFIIILIFILFLIFSFDKIIKINISIAHRKLSTNNDYHKLNNIINIYHPNDKVNCISNIKNKNGDLFIFTNINDKYSKRVIYAMTSSGQNYFKNSDKYYKIISIENNSTNKYPLYTFLYIDGIEYLISLSQDGPLELYDLKNDKIYDMYNLFITKSNSVIRKNVFTSLKFYNNTNYILNGFVDKKKYNIYIQKLYFQEYSIRKDTVFNINETNSDIGYKNSSVTCFEIKEFIICLYVNNTMLYIVSIFDIHSFEKIYDKVIENDPINADELFSKCIYIKNNIGAFIYYINNNSSPIISFKELIILPSNSIPQINDYINPITINENNQFKFGNNYIYNDIIKMDDNNIYYISTDKESENIMIVLIKLLNNDKNLLISYYDLELKNLYNMQIFTDITSFIFNDYLGIGMTHYDYNLNNNKDQTYSSFFIIGNSSIDNITIPDDIDIFDEDNIYEFKIENLHFTIDNNIFGYIPKGIQILSELNGEILGFNLYSKSLQKNININDIILINDSYIFIIDTYYGAKLGNYLFEFIPIISEPNFDDINSNFNLVEYYPKNNMNNIDFRTIYKPKLFMGKKSFLSFSISKCYKTCEKCLYRGDKSIHYCEKCSSKYPYYILTNYKLNTSINCYESCPENYISENNNKYSCIKKIISTKEKVECFEDSPYEIIENGTCVKDCSAINFFMEICKINYDNIEAKEKLINNIKNEIKSGALNSFLINITNNHIDLLINDDNKNIYQITSTFNQNYKDYNISTVNLGECENILKKQYNININDSLILFKIDYYVEGLNIPIIEYEVFHPDTKESLNLTYCKDLKINISIPVSIDEDKLIQYNSSSDYYHDICYISETENNTDITLYDRKIEYNENNMSLCEKNCEYEEYNLTTKRVRCECDIKTKINEYSEIVFDFDKLKDKFLDIEEHSNIGVIKCYKILFKKEGLIYNIGSYILLLIIFLHFIFSIIFCTKGYKSLYDIMKIIIKLKKRDITTEKSKIRNSERVKLKSKTKKNQSDIRIIKINCPIKKLPKNNNNSEQSNKSIQFLNLNSKKRKNNKKLYIMNSIENSKKTIISINKKINEKYKGIIIKLDYTEYELNSLPYIKALKYDKRNYWQYYCSLIKTNNILLFSFYPNFDYNSRIIKISLFFVSFSLYFTINTLFFTDSTMHKIYEDEGDFDYIYQIPQILYSSIISGIINYFIKLISLSQRNILELKRETIIKSLLIKSSKIVKCLNIKFVLYFILSYLLLFFFWYYISCFCAVYKNTQTYLIIDTLTSFSLSLVYPFFLCLFAGFFRIPSLTSKTKNKDFIYKISKFLQIL